jgi:hypothetical protein
MIRQWIETRISGLNDRFAKGVEHSGVTTVVKNNWIEVVYIVGIIVMSAGIVSALAQPVDQSYLIYPGTGGQTIAETVINSMALAMGFVGLYFSYLSGRQTVKPRLVGFFLVVGLLLITGAIYLETYIYISK